MQYLISFLEGIITFISPCLLPMLPIYISYFAGGGERTARKTLTGVSGFVLGFTVVFTAMGALAGTLGSFLQKYSVLVNLICGAVIILFGLNYMGVLKLNLFKGVRRSMDMSDMGFGSAMVFGMMFSIGWTPCVGAFLGSALMLASQQGHVLEGMGMLLSYSLGLGVPFLLSAVFIDRMKGAFNWIKQHYNIINKISGGLLVLIGIAMATGYMGRFLALMSGSTTSIKTIVVGVLILLAVIAVFCIGSYLGKKKSGVSPDPLRVIRLIATLLLLAILVAGAYLAYERLAPTVENNQISSAVPPASQEVPEETAPQETEPPKVPAYDFTVYDGDGEKHKLSDFRGKPVIMNFWATWCGYCKMEMPDFQKKFEEYGDQIHFMMIDITDGQQETFEKASAYVEQEGFTFPVYYDMDWEVQKAYHVSSLPTTYFIDADGNFVAQGRGALNAEAIQSGIDLLLPKE